MKALAFDREDWKVGRDWSDAIRVVRYGNLDLPLDAVVMGTGASGTTLRQTRTNEYGVFANVAKKEDGISQCPDRPLGGPLDQDMDCFIFLHTLCEEFPEDYTSRPQDLEPINSGCFVMQLSIFLDTGSF